MGEATLTIAEDTAMGLQLAADELGVSMEEVAEGAFRRYLRQDAERKIEREEIVYHSRREELLTRFSGQYIAMHRGEVIDSDRDEVALYVRVQQKHPTVGILIKRVDGAEDVWVIRSCANNLSRDRSHSRPISGCGRFWSRWHTDSCGYFGSDRRFEYRLWPVKLALARKSSCQSLCRPSCGRAV